MYNAACQVAWQTVPGAQSRSGSHAGRDPQTLKIVFGWHLDGPTCPETPSGEAHAFDEAVVGPLGLLQLLEDQLGRSGPGAPAALRIAQFLARLRAIDDGNRFYSQSFAADPWATARLLLSWRDALVAAGWSAGSAAWESPRLAVMAEAASHERLTLAPGVPDRVRAHTPHICRPSPLAELALVDRRERLPPVWRRLLDALEAGGTRFGHIEVEAGRRDNDLGVVQRLLAGGGRGTLSGDQSIGVVTSDDELTAGDIAAEWLAAAPDENAGVAIVRQGDATILDAACRRLGLPRPGGGVRSPYRGALQVLPLAFETAWQPLDAGRLLELLVMRGSPVPYRTGRYFANVLRDFPGTGGARWQLAWEQAIERFRTDRAAEDIDEATLERDVDRAQMNWRTWLEPERFDRDAGIAATAADAICRRVQQWATRRAAAGPDTIYVDAAAAAGALAATIAASGVDSLSKAQLDRMIDAVVADGAAPPATLAEAAPWTTVDDPAQVWGRVPSLLWWGCADPGFLDPGLPWTAAERSELAAAGTELPAPGDAPALRLDAQRRAILNATDRVLLFMPAQGAGTEAATHPVWHEISSLEGRERIIVDAAALRRAAGATLGGRSWQAEPVPVRGLPGPVPVWQAPGGRIGARDRESATSLESLLGCPLQWVLRHHAHLREGVLLDMADGNRLKGNVAHEVLARFLSRPPPADDATVRDAVAALLDELLPAIGSPLLLPGRLRDREDLRQNTVEGAVALVQILREASLSVTATERTVDIALDPSTVLEGVIDLELATGDGQPLIVDLKWSNSDRYRLAELEEVRPVQLAAYARLLKDDGQDAFPPAAYFMMKQRRLLAVDSEAFPARARIAGNSLETVWDAVLAARARLLDELSSGRVVATGVEDAAPGTGDAATGELTLEPPCRFCRYGRLCGQRPHA